MTGITNDLRTVGRREVRSDVVIYFYEVFEKITEILLGSECFLMVNLEAGEEYRMSIMTELPDDEQIPEEIKALEKGSLPKGTEISIDSDDGAIYLTAVYAEGGAS